MSPASGGEGVTVASLSSVVASGSESKIQQLEAGRLLPVPSPNITTAPARQLCQKQVSRMRRHILLIPMGTAFPLQR
jgi:hypothetical protein